MRVRARVVSATLLMTGNNQRELRQSSWKTSQGKPENTFSVKYVPVSPKCMVVCDEVP